MTKSLTLADFLTQLSDVIDVARFGASITPNLLFLHPDGSWWKRSGNALKAADPPALVALAHAALANPMLAVRHSDYCKVDPCTCPPEYVVRETYRRTADPLLRAVDEVRRFAK